MAVRKPDDCAEDEEECNRADDEAGEGGSHVGAMRSVRCAGVRMRVGHGENRMRGPLLGDAHAVDDVVLLDLLYHVQSLDDLTEHGVDTVQVSAIGVVEDDEELTAAGVFSGVSH